ncbi:MAG TPA: hypothetical protein VHL52_12900 [Acidimicrobiia bacterium]|nr:hypothetical protein [Acidimicrobiia bacterium]
MAQQPNVELSPADLPAPVLEPAPARRQKIPRPGVITTPAEKPSGPGFGNPGPDTGWALRVIAESELPAEATPRVRRLLAALMGARAAHYGRAPTYGDLRVALDLVGLGDNRSDEDDARRRRWLEAMSHERTPGGRAVAEAGPDLYAGPRRIESPSSQ